MEILRVGSLNINGMRDGRKNEVLSDIIDLKDLSVKVWQETHSTCSNEVNWGLWWKGEFVLSHGTNLNSGVAVLFSPTVKVKVLSKNEVEPGRFLMVKVEISNFKYLFVNIYVPNFGAERSLLFKKFENLFKEENEDVFIVGGDWNCTLDFTLDRNGEEPNAQSATSLVGVIKKFNLSDVWREHNPFIKQYTWVKVCNERISAARLDRFYISGNLKNRVVSTEIIPNMLSDHKLIRVGFTLSKSTHKILVFWEAWQTEKSLFESIIQWWEVGKVHIRDFSQKYSAYSSVVLKNTLKWLETEIVDIEMNMTVNDDVNLKERWTEKKKNV